MANYSKINKLLYIKLDTFEKFAPILLYLLLVISSLLNSKEIQYFQSIPYFDNSNKK
jgi:hypothetical protein